MSQPTHDETAARMSAITAAEIIADVTRDGLPLVAWTIEVEHAPFSEQFPLLVGVCHSRDGREREDVIRAYGEYLGVEPRDPYGRGPDRGRYIEVTAELRGVWTRVWALQDGAR